MKTITINETDLNKIIMYLREVQVPATVGSNLVNISNLLEQGIVKEEVKKEE